MGNTPMPTMESTSAIAEERAVKGENEAAAATQEAQEPTVAECFSFHHLPEASFPNYESKQMEEHLLKWNLNENVHMVKFRFDQKFERFDAEQFVRDFFSDPTVQAHVQVATRGGMVRGPGAPTAVSVSKLNTTATNLEFFDCLKSDDLPDGPIVREDGKIAGCFEEWEEGVCIQDRLRMAMCKQDTDEWDAIPGHMRQELLFAVFRHLVLGGSMCQWEDNMDVYLGAARMFYKDLVKARKNPDNQQIEITTLAYQVNSVEGAGELFPNPYAPNNWCLILIDPVPRQVTYYYHGFVGFM